MTISELTKFLGRHREKYEIDPLTGCYEWVAGYSGGYGQLYYNGHPRKVYRITCELQNGPPPSQKHHASHLCHNKKCIRPDHLVWELPKENFARRRLGTKGKGYRQKGKKFEVRSWENGKQVYLGIYETEAEAARVAQAHWDKENERKRQLKG